MTKQTTNEHWQLTATIDTALCIGDSGSNHIGADKTTVKTTDGKLYIPASTLKGIWRHACEVIACSQDHYVCKSPRAENMCPCPKEELVNENTEAMQDNHCIICQIFGSPKLKSKTFISDLIHEIDSEIETTVIRSGVTINRNRRVAEDQRLYFTETSIPNAKFEFSGDVSFSSDITNGQIELLNAGLNYIHAVGSGKTRGLGWVSITKEDITSNTQTTENEASVGAISESRPTSEGFTELSLQVTLKSPIITGGRKPSGQAVEALNYIRGGLIRGAVANELLADTENSKPDTDFQKLFTEDDAGIFRHCKPATKILPATAIGCKDTPGFIADGKHGIFDSLIERIVSEKADRLYQPNCPYPKCGGRIEAQNGFYEVKKGSHKEKRINTRLFTRVAINRQRKVAEDGLLYHLTAIDPVIMKTKKRDSKKTVKAKKVVLHGSVRVPSSLVDKIVHTLEQKVMRLGGGPLIIKASDQGADPTKPDMEFVETYHDGDRSVYLPGSSLKGAIRAHCERIVRTLGSEHPVNRGIWTCNPLRDKENDPRDSSCSKKLDNENKARKKANKSEYTGSKYHTLSCTVCRLFGNTVLASRACIEDAYPINPDEIKREERNGIAVDRVFGSVAFGPFNFEVITAGVFKTMIRIKNFTTAQLALIALVIRDFDEQRIGIGFAKSRGLGQVNMKVNKVEIRYPTAVVEDEQVRMMGKPVEPFDNNIVAGAGQLVNDAEDYGLPTPDVVNVKKVEAKTDAFGLGATLRFEEEDDITALWRGCVGSWRSVVEGEQ